MNPTPEARIRREKNLQRMQIVSIVICASLLIMVAFTMLFALAGRDQSHAVKQGNDAASCRAQFSGAVSDARQELDDARADLQVHQFDGEVAGLVADDQAALERAVAAGNSAKSKIALARLDYSSANQRYVNLLRAESHDPDFFLQLCADAP